MLIRTSKRAGFSLIETVIALGITGLIILSSVTTFYYTISLHSESNNKIIALNDAIHIAERCRFMANTAGLTGPGSVTDGTVNWNAWISNLLANETIQVSWVGTNPLEVTVTVNWTERNRASNLSLTTLLTIR